MKELMIACIMALVLFPLWSCTAVDTSSAMSDAESDAAAADTTTVPQTETEPVETTVTTLNMSEAFSDIWSKYPMDGIPDEDIIRICCTYFGVDEMIKSVQREHLEPEFQPSVRFEVSNKDTDGYQAWYDIREYYRDVPVNCPLRYFVYQETTRNEFIGTVLIPGCNCDEDCPTYTPAELPDCRNYSSDEILQAVFDDENMHEDVSVRDIYTPASYAFSGPVWIVDRSAADDDKLGTLKLYYEYHAETQDIFIGNLSDKKNLEFLSTSKMFID